jgi:oxygen-dependent protoporphyrinogen oxidase
VLALEDHTLVARVAGELREAIGLRGPPVASRVTHWERALPRYEPGHIDRVARIEDALPGLPGVALAGSAYRGIGVPQCITQGQSAAERVLAAVGAPNRQSQIPSA